jgi:hypothetical protein
MISITGDVFEYVLGMFVYVIYSSDIFHVIMHIQKLDNYIMHMGK